MKNSNITNEERRRMIHLYLNGRQVSEISQIFKYKKPTIYAIIKKYNQTGIIEKGLKGGVRKQAISVSEKNDTILDR